MICNYRHLVLIKKVIPYADQYLNGHLDISLRTYPDPYSILCLKNIFVLALETDFFIIEKKTFFDQKSKFVMFPYQCLSSNK